ncbi:MAG: T9SS type A sorting domain-containing protein [Bacteroidetes bacterium]|nr:T9SS type A sorting domain-containing protein [Bacteroidota bacterium]
MNKILLLSLALWIALPGFSQKRPCVPGKYRNYALVMERNYPISENTGMENTPVKPESMLDEGAIVGNTYYDNQSNSSMQSRLHVFDDGTMGVVFTYGIDQYNNFPDRGTGYNYFNGADWDSLPTERIESDRTGWPAYAPYGENGEIVVSHATASIYDGLFIEKRENKGMGDWEEMIFEGPTNPPDLLWSRLATGGVDHSIIFLLALTNPAIWYQGQYGALVYSRSTDGGQSWQPENGSFDCLGPDYYSQIYGDTYDMVAKDTIVAILYGCSSYDLGLLKSTDGGQSFTQTIIWEHPYPFYGGGITTDTFYCADGAHHLAIDSEGLVHVVFGINRSYSDVAGIYWFPLVDGVAYWNENRPVFSNDLNALCPYSDCEYSELVEDYSLIGWAQDVNQNGEWDILGQPGLYYVGASSQPQITITEFGGIRVVYSSLTETFNNGSQDYRHLWTRTSPNGDFWGAFHDLNSDASQAFDECVFPSIASYSNEDEFYVVYQSDNEPGMAVRGDMDPYAENLIRFPGIITSTNEYDQHTFSVSQNVPNPASDLTTFIIEASSPFEAHIEIINSMGIKVLGMNTGLLLPGNNKISLGLEDFLPGVYIYNVMSGNSGIIKKMIVR